MKHCNRQGCNNLAEAYGFCGFTCEKYHKETIKEQDGFRLYWDGQIYKIKHGDTLHYEGSNEQYALQAFEMIIEAYDPFKRRAEDCDKTRR